MFKINVKTLRGDILKYTSVSSYEIIDGLIIFTDSKNNETKRYSITNCEIEEMREDQQ